MLCPTRLLTSAIRGCRFLHTESSMGTELYLIVRSIPTVRVTGVDPPARTPATQNMPTVATTRVTVLWCSTYDSHLRALVLLSNIIGLPFWDAGLVQR
jgi:hypothetical protein